MSKSLTPAKATEKIRGLAQDEHLSLYFTSHYRQRLEERQLINSDTLHLLSTGFVYEEGEPSTRNGFWKYKIRGKTPNSSNRLVEAVVIPSFKDKSIKIITIYWFDEKV